MSWTRFLYTAVIVAHFFANSSDAQTSPNSNACPSSCGDLHNITHPFRFTGDPENCGNKKYELECENNRTVVHLFSGKYYVLAINYNNYTIRIVDVGIRIGNCSSLPLYSSSYHNFYRYELEPYSLLTRNRFVGFVELPFDVGVAAWVDCEKEVKSNSLYTSNTSTASTCIQKSTSSYPLSSGKRHSYFLFGSLRAKDVVDGCRIDEIVMSTLWLPGKTTHQGNVSSFVDFHNKLAYGFELSWVDVLCEDCRARGGYCYTYSDYSFTCYKNLKRRFLYILADFFYYKATLDSPDKINPI